MSESHFLTATCGHCGARLRIKTHQTRKVVTCPKCKSETVAMRNDASMSTADTGWLDEAKSGAAAEPQPATAEPVEAPPATPDPAESNTPAQPESLHDRLNRYATMGCGGCGMLFLGLLALSVIGYVLPTLRQASVGADIAKNFPDLTEYLSLFDRTGFQEQPSIFFMPETVDSAKTLPRQGKVLVLDSRAKKIAGRIQGGLKEEIRATRPEEVKYVVHVFIDEERGGHVEARLGIYDAVAVKRFCRVVITGNKSDLMEEAIIKYLNR